MTVEAVDAVVVGAGIAGLAAAQQLAADGHSVVVVEGRDRIGGRIHTRRDLTAAPVEAGAEFVHTRAAATWGPIRRAGLATVPFAGMSGVWLALGERVRWFPLALAHPAVWPSFGALRAARRAGRAGAGDRSAAAFLDERGYTGAARELAAMLFTGHLPGPLDDVGVAGLVADGAITLETGRNHRLADGYDRLPEHLAAGLDLRLGFEVASIGWSSDRVEVVAADGRRVVARAGVTTLPHGVLAAGDVAFEPALPATKQAAIDRIVTGPVVKVLLALSEPRWPRRMEQLVCGSGPVTVYWPKVLGDGSAMMTAYATGPQAAALSALGGDGAVARVLDDLDRLLPAARIRDHVVTGELVDWQADRFARGAYTYLPVGAVGARADLAAPTGALSWAGSATDATQIAATVDAGYRSGLRAAAEVAARLASA